MKIETLLFGVAVILIGGCSEQLPELASSPPARAARDRLDGDMADPDQAIVVPLQKFRSTNDQKLTLKRSTSASVYHVLWGPYTVLEGIIEPDSQDMAAGEAGFSIDSGYAFTFRPATWPLGRTRRIVGGTVGKNIAETRTCPDCPNTAGFFTAYFCDPVEEIDRLFVISTNDDLCRDCQFIVELQPREGTIVRRVVGVGEFVEIDKDVVSEALPIARSPQAVAFLTFLQGRAKTHSVDWRYP